MLTRNLKITFILSMFIIIFYIVIRCGNYGEILSNVPDCNRGGDDEETERRLVDDTNRGNLIPRDLNCGGSYFHRTGIPWPARTRVHARGTGRCHGTRSAICGTIICHRIHTHTHTRARARVQIVRFLSLRRYLCLHPAKMLGR